MRIAILAALLIGAALIEVVLLSRIVFHQAGGWGEPAAVFRIVIAWAAPFAWCAALIIAGGMKRRTERLTVPLIIVATVGPLFAYVALVGYGHGTLLHANRAGGSMHCASRGINSFLHAT